MRFSSLARRVSRIQALSSRPLSAMVEELSSMSPARARFAEVMEEYRQKHYGGVLFSQYVREMVKVIDINQDGKISGSELNRLLHNIGAEQEVSSQDVREIVEELGEGEDKEIHVDHIEDLILGTSN